jgi:hypothetical protein
MTIYTAITDNAIAKAIITPPKLACDFSLVPPVNITLGVCVAVGIVEFPVEATELVLLVPDAGALVIVVIPEHIVLSVAVVETVATLVVTEDAGL